MEKLFSLGLRASALVATCSVMIACSGIDGGPLQRAGEPTGTIRIVNATNVTLDAVIISDCNNFTHGFNRIDRSQGIPPGQYRDFTVSAGCWDVGAGAVGIGDNRQRMQVQAGGLTEYTMTQ